MSYSKKVTYWCCEISDSIKKNTERKEIEIYCGQWENLKDLGNCYA